ncbi:MAG TPA: CHRD domain-containing protein [Gaiellaceae bacterium]|nr:CHRD domain-containing protein [Gaiellaceae bacterium]
MRKRTAVMALAVLAAGLMVASLANATGGGKKVFKASLHSHNEVPAISSNGFGDARLRAGADGMSFTYELSYGGLNAAAAAAHIHLGQANVNGGVAVFLCGGGGKPACPAGTGGEESVTGTIVPADIIGPAGQGLAAGEWDELVRAMRAGVTYVNVHTSLHPGGEIRDQLK